MNAALFYLNAALAGFVVLASFGSLNKMRRGRTLPCIFGATLLILLGAGGNALGAALAAWEPYADTLLFAGVAALLVATQRLPTWVGERWANPLASVLVLLGLGVLAVSVAFA